MTNRQLYVWYIAAGIMYVLVKIIFVATGYLHLGAITHGMIPGVLTVLAGVFVLRKTSRPHKTVWSLILVILPVLVLLATPPFMYAKQGPTWLDNGRLPVLIIYECLALFQLLVAVRARKLHG